MITQGAQVRTKAHDTKAHIPNENNRANDRVVVMVVANALIEVGVETNVAVDMAVITDANALIVAAETNAVADTRGAAGPNGGGDLANPAKAEKGETSAQDS